MPIKNKDRILDLVKAICTRVREKGGYLNKTKLIKYLYLVDVEYYRMHKEMFTGFNWIFKDFGPWAFEYNEIYEAMERAPDFRIDEGNRPDLDTKFIKTTESLELGDVIRDFDIELKVRRIIDRWADEITGPMLNYVYFNTEPMVDAERGKTLDFTKIHRLEPIPRFELSKGSLDAKELAELKKKIRERIDEERKKEKPDCTFTPPHYDEIYWEGMTRLDKDNSY